MAMWQQNPYTLDSSVHSGLGTHAPPLSGKEDDEMNYFDWNQTPTYEFTQLQVDGM